jgi:hypothetical protein
MAVATWNDDYVKNYNAISAATRGGADRRHVILAAIIMTIFKKLIEALAADAIGDRPNPFDLEATS